MRAGERNSLSPKRVYARQALVGKILETRLNSSPILADIKEDASGGHPFKLLVQKYCWGWEARRNHVLI